MKITKKKLDKYTYEIYSDNRVIGRAENQLDYWEAYTVNFDDFSKQKTLRESIEYIVKHSKNSKHKV